MSVQFLLKRGVETWDCNDRGREFYRRGAQKLNALDLVMVLNLGTFNSVPWFDLSVWLGVVLVSMIQRYGGCPVLSVLNINIVSLKAILNLIGSQWRDWSKSEVWTNGWDWLQRESGNSGLAAIALSHILQHHAKHNYGNLVCLLPGH